MIKAMLPRLGAEVLGTFILVFFGGAASLFAAGGALGATFAFAFALMVAVMVVGPISGAHVNPAVTTALAVRGRFPWGEVPAYWLAQLVGATVAGYGIFLVYGNVGVKAGLATTQVAAGASSGVHLIGAALAELLGTFLLGLAVVTLTDPERSTRLVAMAFGIGLGLFGGSLAAAAITGGSVNPARTIGPQIIYSLAGGQGGWSHIWVYIVGPLLGGALAGIVHQYVVSGKATKPAAASNEVRTTRARA